MIVALSTLGTTVGCDGPAAKSTEAVEIPPSPASASVSGRATTEHRASPAWVKFSDITAASGVDFTHVSGTSPEKPFPAANGSGIASLDFDRDG